MLEVFDVGPCEDAHQMGFLIGRRFSTMIRSRVATDLILQHQLIPFSRKPQSQPFIQALSTANRKRFPRYWDEMVGTAEGSGVSVLDILLLNFRKEILPFIPKNEESTAVDAAADAEDCSDVLVVNESMAVAAHNEDANVALIGHVYLLRAKMSNGLSFTAYTYAGELPSCAFGFNSHGLAFTLNSVPPLKEEIVAQGIGRNFISRDLLESNGLDDALERIRSSDASVGHSYNLIDVRDRRILNVETASMNRISVQEVGSTPFFHANMYLHLPVKQMIDPTVNNGLDDGLFSVKAHDENSINRQRRAAHLSKQSKPDILSLLGDSSDDEKYPIYMQGGAHHKHCVAQRLSRPTNERPGSNVRVTQREL
ncbi:uncharacterized protein LOC131246558 isoform X2 [Magnolia sinica]|uniref:uncharacterized protein LOC131246558 isoform X2 n=1 Tax=Magnolia sinica TaxID=86752 RepID=UPI0026599B89|nr:uncharacterized protein LOC131246558 isoform X2 [Magnolia sinica]